MGDASGIGAVGTVLAGISGSFRILGAVGSEFLVERSALGKERNMIIEGTMREWCNTQ